MAGIDEQPLGVEDLSPKTVRNWILPQPMSLEEDSEPEKTFPS